MSEPLLIHITELPLNIASASAEQLPCSVRSNQAGHWYSCSLASLRDDLQEQEASERRATVFIPNLHVLSIEVTAPRKQHKYLAQILPFLCEEKLACDIDSVHISHGPAVGETIPVRIIQRSLLQELRQLMQDQGLILEAIYSDGDPVNALIPYGGQLLWVDAQHCLAVARQNHQAVLCSAPPEQAPALLQSMSATDELNVYRQPLVNGTLDCEITLGLEELSRQGAIIHNHTLPNPTTETDTIQTSWLARQEAVRPSGTVEQASPLPLGPEQLTASSINLLSGEFTPKTVKKAGFRWQPVAMAATMLLGLNVLYLLASGFYFEVKAEQLRADSETLYREYFPQDKRIINIQTQVQNHLNRGANSQQNGFIALLGQFYPNWKQHSNQLSLRSIRFNRDRQEMLLDIDSNSIEQLDQLRRALGEQAELLSANENKTQGGQTGVKGRIKLTGRQHSSSQ